MTAEKRLELITRNLEEVLTVEDLQKLLATNQPLKHYIGFEISGQVHLGSGLLTMLKIKDFVEAGVECTIFLADWHAWINDKLGGDKELIREMATSYFKEAMVASYLCVGGDPQDLHFVLGSDLYHGHDDYWATVIRVAKNTTLARIQRSISILGRQEGESVDFAKLIYPPMQVADILFMKVNLAHAGIDQRKAHVIARDVGQQVAGYKPIALHQPIIAGLKGPSLAEQYQPKAPSTEEQKIDLKMSKSSPDSAIFIHDSPEEIKRKIFLAYCPPKEIAYNPLLNWARHLIFRTEKDTLRIDRSPNYGGEITFNSYGDLETCYAEGKLHPADLKEGVGEWLIEKLAPARKYFEEPKRRQALEKIAKLTSK